MLLEEGTGQNLDLYQTVLRPGPKENSNNKKSIFDKALATCFGSFKWILNIGNSIETKEKFKWTDI